MTKALLVLLSLSLIVGGPLLAQTYQCNWSVVDQGGGLMSSTIFRATPSVGQTAIGLMTSTSFQGFIGFWQIDTSAGGIQENEHRTAESPFVTRLFDPAPNPGPGNAFIRYSLATETHVTLRLFDLAGRNVRSLVNARQKPGNYQLRISDFQTGASRLARGVYFVKMRTDCFQATRKLILTE
jgi:hypothetical protein